MSRSEPEHPRKKWWCNFCGFTTDDRQAYLAHSCREVLAAKDTAQPAVPERNCR